MQVTLTPRAEELLRQAARRHPEQSPEQIVEGALTEQARREETGHPGARLTVASFRTWLDQFTAYSDRIPAMPGETFSRETIYQDHD